MDDGSTVTLVDDSIAKRIGEIGPTDPLKMETINGMKFSKSASRTVTINLKGLNGSEQQMHARTVKYLQVSTQQEPREQVERCKHLLDTRDHLTYTKAKPQVLIGQDNWHIPVTSEVSRGDNNQPVVSLISMGWVLHGSRTRTLRHKTDFIFCIREEPDTKKNAAHDKVKGVPPKFSKSQSRYSKQIETLVGNGYAEPALKQKGLDVLHETEDTWPTDKSAPIIEKRSGTEKIHISLLLASTED